MNTLNCLKCGYEWFPRRLEKPKVCPKCKSYNWEIKKTKNNNFVDGAVYHGIPQYTIPSTKFNFL